LRFAPALREAEERAVCYDDLAIVGSGLIVIKSEAQEALTLP
jgi:hypothetical protein